MPPLSNLGGSPGNGNTNLAYVPSPTGGTVTSDSGSDASLTLADVTNAGLMSPADFGKLSNISGVTTAQAAQIERSRLVTSKNLEDFINEFCGTATAETIRGIIDPSSNFPTLHAHIVRNRLSWALAQGNGPAIHRNGMDELIPDGTLTTRTIAADSLYNRRRRVGVVSGSAANSMASLYHDNQGDFIGDGTNGGFMSYLRFSITDPAAVAQAKMFLGADDAVAAPVSTDNPGSLLNCIGIGHGSADTTLKIYYGGSTAQSPVPLGANFPCNVLGSEVYDFGLFAFPGLANQVAYHVKRLSNGNVATGLLSAATPGLQLPLPTTPLSLGRFWRCNGTTALPVGWDLFELWQGHYA